MITDIIITYILILILNYAFVYSMIYITFRSLNGRDSDSFFERVLGINTSKFYGMMQFYTIIPFLGTLVSGLFLYLYYKNREQGHSKYYSVFLAYRKEDL
jgi:hypothetical protein